MRDCKLVPGERSTQINDDRLRSNFSEQRLGGIRDCCQEK